MVQIRNDNLDLTAIADSGQCFRWARTETGYRIIAFGKVLHISEKDNNIILDCSETEFNEVWKDYLDLDTDYSYIIGCIPETDMYLKAAAECGSGIRILRQDPWETLITFIISQRKNIPAIKQAVEKICAAAGRGILLHGAQRGAGHGPGEGRETGLSPGQGEAGDRKRHRPRDHDEILPAAEEQGMADRLLL